MQGHLYLSNNIKYYPRTFILSRKCTEQLSYITSNEQQKVTVRSTYHYFAVNTSTHSNINSSKFTISHALFKTFTLNMCVYICILIYVVHKELGSNWQIFAVLHYVAKTGKREKKDENSQSLVAYLFLLNKII